LILIGLISLVIIIKDLRKISKIRSDDVRPKIKLNYKLVLYSFILLSLYGILLPMLGFIIGTFLFVIGLQLILKWPHFIKQWIIILITASCTTILLYLIFVSYLSILLPEGVLSSV